jgi:hypothetical protein
MASSFPRKLGFRSLAVVVAWTVVAVSCGGSEDTGTAGDRRRVIGGDLLLAMEPGQGHGEFADSLIAVRADPFGGADPGSADHVAFFQSSRQPQPFLHTPEGVVHVVTFTAGRENPRGGEPELCLSIAGGASCGPGMDQPGWRGWGDLAGGFYAAAFGGLEAVEAVLNTESGNTVSVLIVGGYAYAEWSDEWGRQDTIEFYDTTGSLLILIEIPRED